MSDSLVMRQPDMLWRPVFDVNNVIVFPVRTNLVSWLCLTLYCVTVTCFAPFKPSSGGTIVKQSRYTPWRRLGERMYSSYSFSTSALDGGEWSASRPGRAFTPGERTLGAHCTGGWVGLRAGLDTEARGKILCPCRGSNPDHPVRSQTLYCLS
jgi:hypothetical protein